MCSSLGNSDVKSMNIKCDLESVCIWVTCYLNFEISIYYTFIIHVLVDLLMPEAPKSSPEPPENTEVTCSNELTSSKECIRYFPTSPSSTYSIETEPQSRLSRTHVVSPRPNLVRQHNIFHNDYDENDGYAASVEAWATKFETLGKNSQGDLNIVHVKPSDVS